MLLGSHLRLELLVLSMLPGIHDARLSSREVFLQRGTSNREDELRALSYVKPVFTQSVESAGASGGTVVMSCWR